MKVSDRPVTLALDVVDLLKNPVERRRLKRAAELGTRDLASWKDATRSLAACYEELLVSEVNRSPESRGPEDVYTFASRSRPR